MTQEAKDITVEQLLAAYASGYFPMAESRESKEVFWYYPEARGILPLEDFHVPKSLAKLVKKSPFTVTFDKAFPDVLKACADARTDTWINDTIIALYTELFERGHAHSVECWEGEKLVGGLYGVSLGRAFFGESMFSTASGASKIALVYLVERLREQGYVLLDTQYVNDHLLQFGVIEISRAEYLEKLKAALR